MASLTIKLYKFRFRVIMGTDFVFLTTLCCIRCGPDEERILGVVPREDGARNSG